MRKFNKGLSVFLTCIIAFAVSASVIADGADSTPAFLGLSSAQTAYTVFLPSGAGYSTAAAEGFSALNIAPGASFSFTLCLNEGYTDCTPEVAADGNVLRAENGLYRITDINSDVNVTVTGVVKNSYTVTLPDNDSCRLVAAPGYDASRVLYGSAFKFTAVAKAGYTQTAAVVKLDGNELTPDFNGVYTLENIAGNIMGLTACISALNTYTATFKNTDGSVLAAVSVTHGEVPVYNGATPVKESTAQYYYSFTGWTPVLAEVTGDTVYTAAFSRSVREYTVRFVNYDNTLIEEYPVEFGSAAVCSVTPWRPADNGYAYSFIGWNLDTSAVTSDMTVTARYEHIHTYKILVIEATCTEPGYSMKICTGCGYNITYNHVYALGHSYGAWTVVTPATETEPGERTCVCDRCGNILTEEIPAGTPPETTTEQETETEPVSEPEKDNSFIAKLRALIDRIIAIIKSMFIK